MQTWDFKCELEVRDYEIDMQGVVNHSLYINYLEHCRSMYIDTLGIDVHKYHMMGYDLMVIRSKQDYKSPLRPKEKFYVTARMSREGRLRIVFAQEIRRQCDNSLVLNAEITVVCVNIKNGRPCMPEMLETIFKRQLA